MTRLRILHVLRAKGVIFAFREALLFAIENEVHPPNMHLCMAWNGPVQSGCYIRELRG